MRIVVYIFNYTVKIKNVSNHPKTIWWIFKKRRLDMIKLQFFESKFYAKYYKRVKL